MHNKKQWCLVILAFLIIIVLMFIFYPNIVLDRFLKQSPPLQTIKKTDITNGSLIFLSRNAPSSKVFRIATGSYFSHVGFAFWENGILYILDCDVGGKMKKGVRVQTFEDKLKDYKGIIGIRKCKRYVSLDAMLNLLRKYIHVGFDSLVVRWLVSDYQYFHEILKNPNLSYCSEFVADSLKDLGLLERGKNSAGFSPGCFTNNLNSSFSSMKKVNYCWKMK